MTPDEETMVQVEQEAIALAKKLNADGVKPLLVVGGFAQAITQILLHITAGNPTVAVLHFRTFADELEKRTKAPPGGLH